MNMEALFEQLSQQLALVNRRRSWSDVVLWLPRGLLAALLLAALLAAFSRFWPLFLDVEIAWISILFGFLGIIFTAVLLASRRRSLLEQARFADEKLELLERASTAVEIQQGHIQTTNALAQSQLSEALQVYKKIDIRNKIPLRMHFVDIVLLVAVIILLAGAIILPNKQNDLLAAKKLVNEEIDRQVIALEALEEAISNDSELSEESLDELLTPLGDAVEELREADPSREFAVAVLSEAGSELRELSAQNATSLTDKNLEEAATPLAQNKTSREFGQSLQRGQLSAASEELFQLSDQISTLSETELSDLARDLADTSANLQNIDPELAADLQRSAQALAEGDLDGGQQALEEAASTLQQRAQEQAMSSQAGQTADQLDEIRRQIAQAGQNGQQAQDSDRPTDNVGTASTSGQGEEQGSGPGIVGIDEASQGAGGPGPGGGHVDQVFVPEFADLADIDGVNIELQAECSSNPDSCGSLLGEVPTQFSTEESLVPYSQVYGDYRDTAYQTLDSEYIPLNMRSYVRDYFSSLEP